MLWWKDNSFLIVSPHLHQFLATDRLRHKLNHAVLIYYLMCTIPSKVVISSYSLCCRPGNSIFSSQNTAEPENVRKTYRFWTKTYPIWVTEGGGALKWKIHPVLFFESRCPLGNLSTSQKVPTSPKRATRIYWCKRSRLHYFSWFLHQFHGSAILWKVENLIW